MTGPLTAAQSIINARRGDPRFRQMSGVRCSTIRSGFLMTACLKQILGGRAANAYIQVSFYIKRTIRALCARYSLTSPAEAVRAFFRAPSVEDFPPRYNIAPSQPVLIARNDVHNRPELQLVR